MACSGVGGGPKTSRCLWVSATYSPGLKPSEHLGHFIDVRVGPPNEASKRAERPAGNHCRPHVFLQLPRGDVGDLFDSDRPGPADVDVLTVHARDVDRA